MGKRGFINNKGSFARSKEGASKRVTGAGKFARKLETGDTE
jgi:hypothetical protein